MIFVFISFLLADGLCWFIYSSEKKKVYLVIGIVLAVCALASLIACIRLALLGGI